MSAPKRRQQDDQAVRLQLEQCVTQFDVFRFLREITRTYGFEYFFIANLTGSEVKTFADMMIITSAPSDLIQRYEDNGLMEFSPFSTALKSTGAPFEYRLDGSVPIRPADRQALLDAFMRDYDLDCWFVTPVHHPDHGRAAVCFIGKRAAMSFSETAELALLAHLTHHQLRQVSAKPAKASSPLTDRERECLIWTSGGKTSVEIARILDLSEHTVNHYLNNAARKLDAVNRTQAVAYALRQGFID